MFKAQDIVSYYQANLDAIESKFNAMFDEARETPKYGNSSFVMSK